MNELAKGSTEAAYTVEEWCPGAKISRPYLYTLDEQYQPHSVKIGRRRIITESPTAWYARIAALGGIPSKRSKVAA